MSSQLPAWHRSLGHEEALRSIGEVSGIRTSCVLSSMNHGLAEAGEPTVQGLCPCVVLARRAVLGTAPEGSQACIHTNTLRVWRLSPRGWGPSGPSLVTSCRSLSSHRVLGSLQFLLSRPAAVHFLLEG